jgi:hypothetical protein
VRSLRGDDPRTHRCSNRFPHLHPPRRHCREVGRRSAGRVRIVLDLGNRRTQRRDNAGPGLVKLDLGHRPMLPDNAVRRKNQFLRPEIGLHLEDPHVTAAKTSQYWIHTPPRGWF